MISTITISEELRRLAESRNNVKYGVVIDGVAAQDMPGKTAETIAAYQAYARAFGTNLLAAGELIAQSLAFRDEAALLLASYVAARFTAQQASAKQRRGEFSFDAPLSTRLFSQPDPSLTERALMRLTLEELLANVIESRASPIVTAADYFTVHGNASAKRIYDLLPERQIAQLNNVTWSNNGYSVRSIHLVKPQRQRTASHVGPAEETPVDQSVNNLRQLLLDGESILPRDGLICDNDVLVGLERGVELLFAYDFAAQRNPYKAAGRFKNRVLLQGAPGEGKTEGCKYLVGLAQRISAHTTTPVELVSFNLNSSWKSGGVKSAEEQFTKVSTDNKLYVVFQDEIGQYFDAAGIRNDDDAVKVLNEFKKFLSGQYPDRGNYLILATVNDVTKLDESVIRDGRFTTVNWAGAVTAEQKAQLFMRKLTSAVHPSRVQLSEQDYALFGQLAARHNFSGAQIAAISDMIKETQFEYARRGEINQIKAYEGKVAAIKALYAPVTMDVVQKAIGAYVANQQASLRYRGS